MTGEVRPQVGEAPGVVGVAPSLPPGLVGEDGLLVPVPAQAARPSARRTTLDTA